MRRTPLFLMLAAGAALSLAPAQASSHQLPKITGGGHTQNNNSGGPDQTAFGGFVARATDTGTTSQGPFAGSITTYPAEGEVQARSATNDGNDTLIRVHGDVVCIANYGPSSGADGGGDPNGTVWEIRFEVTHSNIPQAVGTYASIFVQDNGREDFADEDAQQSLALDPACGKATQYQLEPHQGQITVHD